MTKFILLGDEDSKLHHDLERMGVKFRLFNRDQRDLPEPLRSLAIKLIEKRSREPSLFRGNVRICRGKPGFSDLKYLMGLYPDSGVKR